MAALPAPRPQPPTSITDLSDEHLTKVFSRLPVSFLLNHVEHVCKRFKHITDLVYENQQNIVLEESQVESPTTWNNIIVHTLTRSTSVHRHHWLHIDHLTPDLAQAIVAKFPAVASLEIRQGKLLFDPMKTLFEELPKLNSLAVIAFFSNKPNSKSLVPPNPEAWCSLFEMIKECVPNLQHLTVIDWATQAITEIKGIPEMPILETLNIGLHVEADTMDSLCQWPNLRSVGLAYHPTAELSSQERTAQDLKQLMANAKHLSQLKHLSLNSRYAALLHCDLKDLSFNLSQNFASLTSVQVHCSEPLEDFLTRSKLHLLPCLNRLHVNNIGVGHQFTLDFWKICPAIRGTPSYKTLKSLRLAYAPHESFHWANDVLPALEKIFIDCTMVDMCNSCSMGGLSSFRRVFTSEACRNAEKRALESMARLRSKPRVIFDQRNASPYLRNLFLCHLSDLSEKVLF